MARFCFLRAFIIALGGWGIIVSLYSVQDCANKQITRLALYTMISPEQKKTFWRRVKFFLSLIPLAPSFQCIGLLFYTLLIQRKKFTSHHYVFSVYLTSASRDRPARTVYMVKSHPA
mgnify:CR=1 FL=1